MRACAWSTRHRLHDISGRADPIQARKGSGRNEKPLKGYATADTAVEILSFPRSLILEPGALQEPERLLVCQALMTQLSHENMRKYYRLAILSQRGLRNRVLTWLTMQARRRGSRSFRVSFSREELADFLCVNRSALSHELSRMEQEGLIHFHKNEFTLLAEGEAQSTWTEID